MDSGDFSGLFSENFSWMDHPDANTGQSFQQPNRQYFKPGTNQNNDLNQLRANFQIIQTMLSRIDQVCLQICDKKGVQRTRISWNQAEHRIFIQAVEKYGKSNIRQIIHQMQQYGFSEQQVRSHASKYFRKIDNISKKAQQNSFNIVKDNNLLYTDDIYVQYSNNPRISETALFEKLIKPVLDKINVIELPLSINNINTAIIALVNSYRCIPYEYLAETSVQGRQSPVHELLIQAVQGTLAGRLNRQYNIFGYLTYVDANDLQFRLISPKNPIRCFGLDQQLVDEDALTQGRDITEQTFCCFQMNAKPFIRFCIQYVASYILKKRLETVLQFIHAVANHFEMSQDGICYIIKYQTANYGIADGESLLFAFLACAKYHKALKRQ